MIKITSLDHNGKGIGKLNNKIVFVENALPGEIVDITITKEKKNYIEAKINKIIKKSKNRIDSLCPYFNKCGGCELLHINYKKQLEFKQNKIENIVSKYLNNNIKINNIVKSDEDFNYRNKVTFHVKEKIGFYRNKTYEIIPIDNCLISDKLINKSLSYLNELNLKDVNKIICRSSEDELMIIIETNKINLDISPLKELASSIYLKIDSNYKLVYGNEYITEKLGDYKYLISPDSFFQINLNVCFKLYNEIKKYLNDSKNVLDLYCGTGSIGIFISENKNILGIEINKYAIDDAIKNAELNNLKNINFVCGESGKKLNNINFKTDAIIVDPPRCGLSKETIENIFKLNANKLIYVSCDPMTLVRDLNLLSTQYEIIEFTPFDMFPNTKHMENLVLLKNVNKL